MAIVNLTTQTIVRSGLNATYTAATDTNGWAIQNNDGQIFLHVKNGDAAPHTVTIDFVPSVDGQTLTDPTVSVPAGADRFLGPWPPSYYSQTDRTVKFSLDAATGMTAAALKM